MQKSSENLTAGITRLAEPSTARSILSVLLFAHLFCVFVVLASNYHRSALLARLVSFFSIYTEALDFDPNLTPFHLTSGQSDDDDHLLEVELVDGPAAGQKFTLPPARGAWLDERRRFMTLNNLMGAQAEFLADERDDGNDVAAAQLTAEVSKAVGGHYLKGQGGTHAIVRLYHRLSQPQLLAALPNVYPPDDPTAPQYTSLLYTADVVRAPDGTFVATRRQSARDVAPVKAASGSEAAEEKPVN